MSASVPRGTPGRGTQTGSVMVVHTGPDHMAGFQEFDSPETTRFAENTSVTREDDGQTLVAPTMGLLNPEQPLDRGNRVGGWPMTA